MSEFIDWRTQYGSYRYWFLNASLPISTITQESGNYMFVRPTNAGWQPVYIGIADNLRNRLSGHERLAEAIALGATHVMAHTQKNLTARVLEEKDLIEFWNPLLNSQHRTKIAS